MLKLIKFFAIWAITWCICFFLLFASAFSAGTSGESIGRLIARLLFLIILSSPVILYFMFRPFSKLANAFIIIAFVLFGYFIMLVTIANKTIGKKFKFKYGEDYKKMQEDSIDRMLTLPPTNEKNLDIYPENENQFNDTTKKKIADSETLSKIFNEGNEYIQKGNYDEAIIKFTNIIEINPNLERAYYNRGNAYYSKGNYDQAISDFTKVIEINPNDTSAYNNRAITYYYQKNYEKAWDDVHKLEALGERYKISQAFIDDLKRASGRNR